MSGAASTILVFAALLSFSAAGIAFELLLAAFAGYVLGESLLLLSTIVGLFLSSMGLGAHLSRRLPDPATDAYVLVGAAMGFVGGIAPVCILVAAAKVAHVHLTLGLLTILCGGLLGTAIPLAARLLERRGNLSRLLASVLALDYLGALAGSLLLPLVVLPGAGYIRGASLLGCAAVLAAGLAYVGVRRALSYPAAVLGTLIVMAFALGTVTLYAPRILDWGLEESTGERVVYREHSPYQEILLTEGNQGMALRLNGRPQVGERWERAYHEALVHPALSLALPSPRNVLVLGGGDGLALREIRKHAAVGRIELVDLDPQMVALARRHARLRRWNGDSFDDPRVRVVHDDAFLYVQRQASAFDAVIVDLPVPTNISLSKLYSVEFYRNVRRLVSDTGVIAVQSSAFDVSRSKILWCITRTLEAAGLHARPYMVEAMGFHLAARQPIDPDRIDLTVPTTYLTADTARGIFALPADLGPFPVEVNRLENHAILRYVR